MIDFSELEDGFSYRFPAKDSVIQELTDAIKFERKCCPFLNFKLIVEAGKDTLSLELTGQEGTKETLKSLFNWTKNNENFAQNNFIINFGFI